MKKIAALLLALALTASLAACGGTAEPAQAETPAETTVEETAAAETAGETAAEPETVENAEESPAGTETPAGEKPAEATKSAENPAEEKPAVTPKPAEKPAEEKPAEATKPAEKSAEEKPAVTPKPAEKPAEEKPAEPEKQEAPVPEEQPEAEADADLPPDFTLTDQYGKTHRLSDYRGKVVFLNFWATWCPPCRGEMPDIQALYEKELADVVILSVAAPGYKNEQDADGVKAFLDENGYTYPVLMDEGGSVLQTYGVTAYPTTFLFAKNGTVFGYVPGAMSAALMQSVIDQTLAAE